MSSYIKYLIAQSFFWKSAITKYNNGIFEVLLSSNTPSFDDRTSRFIFSFDWPDSAKRPKKKNRKVKNNWRSKVSYVPATRICSEYLYPFQSRYSLMSSFKIIVSSGMFGGGEFCVWWGFLNWDSTPLPPPWCCVRPLKTPMTAARSSALNFDNFPSLTRDSFTAKTTQEL